MPAGRDDSRTAPTPRRRRASAATCAAARSPTTPMRARKHIVKRDPVMRDIVQARRRRTSSRSAASRTRRCCARSSISSSPGPAAAAIERRFLALFDGGIPHAARRSPTFPTKQLRAAGVSRQKAGYMRSLAEHFASGRYQRPLAAARARRRGDRSGDADQGHRPLDGRHAADVLPRPAGRAARSATSASRTRCASPTASTRCRTPTQMEEIAEPWRPYRSAGTWYLWRRGDLVTL